MTSLADFLLARIAEDERTAKRCVGSGDADWAVSVDAQGEINGVLGWSPHRVLRECYAKRQIVDLHTQWGEHLCVSPDAAEDGLWSVTDQDVMKPCPTMLALALPYAEHPDYLPEWKP